MNAPASARRRRARARWWPWATAAFAAAFAVYGLGVLAPAAHAVHFRARTAAALSAVRGINTSLEGYREAAGRYPYARGAPVTPALLTYRGRAYIREQPRDHDDGSPYLLDSDGSAFRLRAPGSYDPATLRGLRLETTGVDCGPRCAATRITYVGGRGTFASP